MVKSPNWHGNVCCSARPFIPAIFLPIGAKSEGTKKYVVSQFMGNFPVPDCNGQKLKRESLSVKIADLEYGELSQLTL